MAHVFPLTVRGYHIDVYRHVNNACYLEFIETARWELFSETGALDWMTKKGIAFVVVNINIDYKAAAYMNDRLDVHTVFNGPVREGKRSGTLTQSIYRGDKLIANVQVVYCCIDMFKERALPFEGELLQHLQNWQAYCESEEMELV